jgi:hypothetical protein
MPVTLRTLLLPQDPTWANHTSGNMLRHRAQDTHYLTQGSNCGGNDINICVEKRSLQNRWGLAWAHMELTMPLEID